MSHEETFTIGRDFSNIFSKNIFQKTCEKNENNLYDLINLNEKEENSQKGGESSTDCSPFNRTSFETECETPMSTNLLKEVELSNFFVQEFQKKNFCSSLTNSSNTSAPQGEVQHEKFSKFLKFFETKNMTPENSNLSNSSNLSNFPPKFKFSSLLKNNWKGKISTFKESRERKLLSKINFLQNSKINYFDLKVSDYGCTNNKVLDYVSHAKPKSKLN